MHRKRKTKKTYDDLEGLNFPVFEKPLPGPPILSMDEYYEFVMANWRWMKGGGRQQRPAAEPFILK